MDTDVDEHNNRLRKFIRIRATVGTGKELKVGCFIPRDDGSKS